MTTYLCSKDASAWKEGNAWSGWDDHHPVGKNQNGNTWRPFIYFPFSKGSHSGVANATLRMRYREGAGNHIAGDTNTCKIHARRMTSSWGEGTDRGENLWSSNESWNWTNRATAYTNSGSTNTDVGNLSSGTWVEWDVTEIVQAWFNGSPNYGFVLLPDDPDEIGKEFGSRHLSGYVPELDVTWIDNVGPNAPTSLAPTGSTVVHTGPLLNVSGVRSDPDSGDYITAYQVQVFDDSAPADPPVGTPLLHDSGTVTVSGTPTSFSRSISGFNGAYFKWRARTRDKGGLWSPWSLTQRVFVNSPPGAPGGMNVDTDTLTPTFRGSFSDPDTVKAPATGGQASEVEITVQTNDGVTTKWASGPLSNPTTTFAKAYAGTALAYGTAYRWRARWKDNAGAWGAYSAWQTWTPVAPAGPDNLTPRTTSAKLESLTPTLTVGHSLAFTNHEIEVRSLGSPTSNMWDPAVGTAYAATTSKGVTYAGATLSWGVTYEWRAKVLVGGVWTGFSAWVPMYINAAPSAPSNLRIDGKPSGSVVTPARPVVRATFEDPDKLTHADEVNSSEHEITRVDNGAHVGGSPILAFGEEGVPTADLPLDVPLRYRAHMNDGTVWGAWSDYATFKRSTAPSVGLTAPANASTVTISQPVLDWSYSGSGGKAQISFRVQIFDVGAGDVLVHDSGTVQSAATSYTVPAGLLQDGGSYRWIVDVTDSDGLTSRLT